MFRLRNIRAASQPLHSNIRTAARIRNSPCPVSICRVPHSVRSLHSFSLQFNQLNTPQPATQTATTESTATPSDNKPAAQLNAVHRRRHTLVSRANLDDLGEFGEPLHSSKFLISSRNEWKKDDIEPRLRDYIQHMHECLSLNHVDRIFQIFQTMQQDRKLKSLHIEVFNTLLQACAKLKQPEAAVATFDSIFKHQLEPNFLSYQYLLDSIILHTDTHLAFDYLCVLNREMATQLRRAREEASNSSAAASAVVELSNCDAFMQENFINICVAFLKRTGRHLSGHPSSRLLDSVSSIEHAISEYFTQTLREKYQTLGVSEAITKLGESRENNLPLLPNSLHDSSRLTALKQTVPQVFRTISDEEAKQLRATWSQVRLMNETLFLHNINRGNLFKAAKYWNHVEYLRAIPRCSKFMQADFSMNSNYYQMARYSHLLTGLSKLQYGLAEIDDFEQLLPRRIDDETLQRRQAKQAEYLKSIPQWHAVRNAMYAEMWTYTQSIMELARKANAGEDPSALESEHIRRMMVRQPSTNPKHGLHQHGNQSHFLKRLDAHSHEAAEPVVTLSKANPYNRNLSRSNGAAAAGAKVSSSRLGGDMRSIDEIVEKLSRESAALDQAHEQARKAEQNLIDIEVNAAREEQRQSSSSSSSSSIVQPTSSNAKGFKDQLEQAFNESADDELQASGIDSDNGESKRILSELKSEVSTLANQNLPTWISELDTSNSLLPPVAQPLFNSELSGRFTHLYRRMMGSLLLYGASNSKRVVTAISYRRNKELVHALYHDYMSLNLLPPDPRILMLGHLNHAPPEFHSQIIRSDDLAYGGNDLFTSLFAGVFKAKLGEVNTSWVRPNSANLTASQLRSTHSADGENPASIPAFSPLLHQQQLRTHFYRVWSAYHANHGWSIQEQGSDFAFRKRTFRLIEELARRGLSPQNSRDPLLPLIIRSLSFTSFSSRTGSLESEGDSVENAADMTFHRKRTTLYETELAHLRRVLRVLFQLMLNQGVTPDSRSMHALIDGCLAHRRVTEAKIILNYMMDKLSVKPDIHTAKLFLQTHIGPQKGGKPLREIVEDVEGILNELVAVVKPLAPRESAGLARANSKLSTGAWSADVSSQIVSAFDSVLQRYEASQDSGAGMLRVHEHLFALGLQPSPRTLKTSLSILLQNPNTQTFGRAKELMQRALSKQAAPMEEDSHLVQFVREVYVTRAKAKEALEQQRQKTQVEVDEAASNSTEEPSADAEPSDATTAASTSTVKTVAVFDPLSENHVVKLAIPFSYESWHSIPVTSHSWLVLLQAADAIGSWIDTWQLYQQFLSHLSRLPSNDSRGRLLLTSARRQIFAVILRSFLHNASHLEHPKQMYYFKFLHDSMACFFWFKADHSSPASSPNAKQDSVVNMKLFSFSLPNDDKMSSLMLPSDYRQLTHLEAIIERGVKISVPEDEVPLVEAQQLLLATIQQKSQTQQKHRIKQAQTTQRSPDQTEVASEPDSDAALAFL